MGKSYAHPLIVLIKLPNDGTDTRFGVSAGRSVGNAVQRNRAKRCLREALRPLLSSIKPGWDVLLLSRPNLVKATPQEAHTALTLLLERADLLVNENGN